MTGYVIPLELISGSLWILRVVFSVLVKTSVLLALTLALDRATRRVAPRFRHLLWFTSITGCLVVLVLSVGGELVRLSPVRVAAAGTGSALASAVLIPSCGVGGPGDIPVIYDAWRRATIGELWSSLWPVAAAAAIILGALAGWARVAGQRIRLLHLERHGILPRARRYEGVVRDLRRLTGITRRIRIVESVDAHTSFTHGVLRPVVVLPQAMRAWPEDRRRSAMLHELCHIRRWDTVSIAAAYWICWLLWFVPLIWLAYSRLCSVQELACDTEVVEYGANRRRYAECIVDAAQLCRRQALVAGLNFAVRSKKVLEDRIRAVMEGETKMKKGWVVCVACVMFVAAAVVLSAAGVETKGKILMVLRGGYPGAADFMLSQEAAVMKMTLEDAGFTVVVATVDGRPLVGSSLTFKADIRMADVKMGDYRGVILPCMAGGQSPIPDEAVEIVKKAVAMKLPLAAQNSAVLILHKAGAVTGKRFAIEADLASVVKEGTYDGIGVVSDQGLATSGTCPTMAMQLGKPDGTQQLVRTFIALMR